MSDLQECPKCERMQYTLYGDARTDEMGWDQICAWCMRDLETARVIKLLNESSFLDAAALLAFDWMNQKKHHG